MTTGKILFTKTSLGKDYVKTLKSEQRNELGRGMNSKFKLYNAVPLSEVHFYDMTRVDEEELQPLPPSGADVLEIIKKYDLREFGTAGDLLDKIETVRTSEFGERYLIINAIESDPGVMHEEWLLHNRADLIELGIKAVKKTCYFHRVVIASRYDVKIENTETAIFDYGYPIEGEHNIVKHALGLELEGGETAATDGILIISVQTLINLGLASAGVEPKTRYLTAANFGAKESKVVRVPFGYFSSDLLVRVYGKQEGEHRFAGQGALNALPIELSPQIDYTTELIAYAKALEFSGPEKCDICGECQKACPLDLPIQAVIAMSEGCGIELKRRDAKKYKDIDVKKIAQSCIKCKACTYACPQGLDPMDELKKTLSSSVRNRLALKIE